MCEPTAIIAGGLAIGGQVANHIGQSKANKANAAAAATELMLNYRDIAARGLEEQTAAGQAREGITEQAAALLSQGALSAAESGIAGGSVDALLGEILGQQGRANANIDANLASVQAQLQREREGAYAGYKSRRAAVPAPSLLATGLGIAGTALQHYSNYKLRKDK